MSRKFRGKERALNVIDGSNLYHRLRESGAPCQRKGGLLDFEYGEFEKWLVGERQLKHSDIRRLISGGELAKFLTGPDRP